MAPPKTFIELYKRIKGDVTTLTSVLATIRLVADNPGKMKLLDANVLELYHEIVSCLPVLICYFSLIATVPSRRGRIVITAEARL
jgi:hypothetical protein